ncbi:alkaline phosphatase family protein [Persicobacter psychrovividus]|uniref:Alkaline phosphatase family protein n=1 Tax=Persicobacter psychrovividus TaxID=387638 RepID=A0ABM7VI55_9BACT|nr:alkaline phosphatase family protein [Persicobacter psychrovividus]
MNRFLPLLFMTIISAHLGYGQSTLKRPKMVLGIVVDQMRYDYLTKYWDQYDENGGFKQLLREGTSFSDMHYNYAPTTTGPGHTTVWSGASPAYSGIANNWYYDRQEGHGVYCVDDPEVETVGQDNDSGKRSPHRMLATNLADELKLFTNHQSKVVSVSIKDRSAILPAGYMADGAFWYDSKTGKFISSTFYMDRLPAWVNDYNAKGRPDELLKQPWELLLPASAYGVSIVDDNPYEGKFFGEKSTDFPHDVPKIAKRLRKANKSPYGMLAQTPHGNTLVTEMAKAAIKGEQLGQHDFPDLLAISYSSTDKIGHQFAPASREVQDTYLRLDRELAELFAFVDEQVGLDEVVIFLTADHAGAQNAVYMADQKFHNAKYVDTAPIRKTVEEALSAKYGEGKWVLDLVGEQLYLDRELINTKGYNLSDVQEYAAQIILAQNAVQDAVTAKTLQSGNFQYGYKQLLANGCHPTRSGDVFIVFHSGVILGKHMTGTSHSMTYNYDTHVPMLMMGYQIPKGKAIATQVGITQIAPTMANILQISAPSAAFFPILPWRD